MLIADRVCRWNLSFCQHAMHIGPRVQKTSLLFIETKRARALTHIRAKTHKIIKAIRQL